MLSALSRWLAYLNPAPLGRGLRQLNSGRCKGLVLMSAQQCPVPGRATARGRAFYTGEDARAPCLHERKEVDPSVIPLITGGGGALVVLAFIVWAFYTGKLHSEREFAKLEAENDDLKTENDQLREALRTERDSSDEMASAAQVTNKLIAALTTLATERHAARTGDITAEDLGL